MEYLLTVLLLESGTQTLGTYISKGTGRTGILSFSLACFLNLPCDRMHILVHWFLEISYKFDISVLYYGAVCGLNGSSGWIFGSTL